MFYLHLVNSVSQVLLWSRPSLPTHCDCDCGVTIGVESCSQLVRDVVAHCVETSIATSQTTTTTRSNRASWDLSWLWLLLIVFTLGFIAGKFCPTLRRPPRAPEPQVAALTSGDSTPLRGDHSGRARRGVAA